MLEIFSHFFLIRAFFIFLWFSLYNLSCVCEGLSVHNIDYICIPVIAPVAKPLILVSNPNKMKFCSGKLEIKKGFLKSILKPILTDSFLWSSSEFIISVFFSIKDYLSAHLKTSRTPFQKLLFCDFSVALHHLKAKTSNKFIWNCLCKEWDLMRVLRPSYMLSVLWKSHKEGGSTIHP